MRYTPGMFIAAVGVVIWFTVTDDVGPYPFVLPLFVAAIGSAILDGLFGVRPFWLPDNDVPTAKFYHKK